MHHSTLAETGPWREAKLILSLQFRDKMNVSEIAKKIGRSRGWVKRRLKLYFEFHDVLTKLNLHSLAKLKEYAHALVMDSRSIVPDRMRKRQGRGNKGGASAIERVCRVDSLRIPRGAYISLDLVYSIAKSISRNGHDTPLIVRGRTVINGVHRLLALKKLGIKEVKCVSVSLK